MVTKKKTSKNARRSTRPKLQSKNPWFRKREGNLKSDWGFIPINWKGSVALVLLIGLNVFAGNYFNLNELVLDNYLKMGVVFLLSVFVFIELAKKKTIGVKR